MKDIKNYHNFLSSKKQYKNKSKTTNNTNKTYSNHSTLPPDFQINQECSKMNGMVKTIKATNSINVKPTNFPDSSSKYKQPDSINTSTSYLIQPC